MKKFDSKFGIDFNQTIPTGGSVLLKEMAAQTKVLRKEGEEMTDPTSDSDGLSLRTKLGKISTTFVIYVPHKQADLFGLQKGMIVDVTIRKVKE